MYKTFLKNINASIRDYFPVPELRYKFDIKEKDKKGNSLTDKIRKVIVNGETLKKSDPLFKPLANNVFAALAYMAKKDTDERRNTILSVVPTLSYAFASEDDLTLAFQYIIYGLKGNPNNDPTFFQYFKERLQNEPSDIPAFIWVTGILDKDLIDTFITNYDAYNAKTDSEIKIMSEFCAALYKHGGEEILQDYYNSKPAFRRIIDILKKELADGERSKSDDKSQKTNIDLPQTIDEFINKLKSSVLNNLDIDIKTDIEKMNELSDDEIVNLADDVTTENKDNIHSFFSNEDVKNRFEELKKSNESNTNYTNWINFIDLLMTANIRGKKMFRLAKAYTRYYIKNMLPNMLKYAGNDPETTSKVIKVSTDEIQDLMYGDTINHPENLAEVNNPAVRDQIAFDVEQAVKGDQIPGGAADGLSIEDIAKKWSEIYKQVPYEHLLDVLKTQEQAGSIVEQEHTDNLEIAKEIARDHLVEAPDYYTHLENMEEMFPAENVAERPLPEPEGMDLQTLENPLPKAEDHICDGSCGGNCKCHHDKVQTVEDKVQGLNGDGMMVIMIEETPEVEEVETIDEQPLDFIQQIAAKIKR